MWSCWICAVSSDGAASTTIAQRHASASARSCLKPTVTSPSSRAACSAAITFGERPEVEIADEHVALVSQRAKLAREHLLEAVVVADRGQRRGVGGERDGGERRAVVDEAADQLGGDVLGVGGAAAVAGEQDLAAILQAGGDAAGDGDDGGDECAVRGGALERLLRAAQIGEDGFLTWVGHGFW